MGRTTPTSITSAVAICASRLRGNIDSLELSHQDRITDMVLQMGTRITIAVVKPAAIQ